MKAEKSGVPSIGNAYDYVILSLARNYFDKSSGIQRIKTYLDLWESRAAKGIAVDTVMAIKKYGTSEFDPNDIMELV